MRDKSLMILIFLVSMVIPNGHGSSAADTVDYSSVSFHAGVVSKYKDKIDVRSLNYLFDGNTYSRVQILPVHSISNSVEQARIPQNIAYTEAIYRPLAVPPIGDRTAVPSPDTMLTTALKLLDGTVYGKELCNALGAEECSLPALRDGGIDISVGDSAGNFGLTTGKWGKFLFFDRYTGANVAVNQEMLKDYPAAVAVILAHELEHARQMDKFHRLSKSPDGINSGLAMELDAEFTTTLISAELSYGDRLSKNASLQRAALVTKIVVGMWKEKMQGTATPPSLEIYLTGDYDVDYHVKILYQAFARLYMSSPSYIDFIGDAEAEIAARDPKLVASYKPDQEFKKYFWKRIETVSKNMRERWFGRRTQIVNCYGDTADPDSDSCDFRSSSVGMKKVNLAMAAEDACAGNINKAVAAQFRVAGMSLGDAGAITVANLYPSDSCMYKLIYGVASDGNSFPSMTNRMLGWFISHGYKFPPPASEDTSSGADNSSPVNGVYTPGGWTGTHGTDWDGNGQGGVNHRVPKNTGSSSQ